MSEEEYTDRNILLHRKYESRETMTPYEEHFFCRCIRFQDIRQYPFCLDEYFRVMYLQKHPQMPQELRSAQEKDEDVYKIMIDSWGKTVNVANHKDHLLNMATAETRKELKALRKSIPIINNFKKSDFFEKRESLLAWTKYRYIIIKNIWVEEFHSVPYKLYLDNQEIIFDEESLAHILSRHFAQTMKQYLSEKSFFTKDFLHTELHKRLEDVFSSIDYNGMYRNQPLGDINFKLNGTIYKIYTEEKDLQIKGKKKVIRRMASFFPLEHPGKLKKLDALYYEYAVEKNLSVFLLK